jgi:hypothetical protein
VSLTLERYQFIIAILNSIAVYVLLGKRLEFFDPYVKKLTNYIPLTAELTNSMELNTTQEATRC